MATPDRVTVARLPEINALVTGNEEKREEEERCRLRHMQEDMTMNVKVIGTSRMIGYWTTTITSRLSY